MSFTSSKCLISRITVYTSTSRSHLISFNLKDKCILLWVNKRLKKTTRTPAWPITTESVKQNGLKHCKGLEIGPQYRIFFSFVERMKISLNELSTP
jgi:hypothetical protein